MLKEPCPYHKGPTNHNLEDCHMLRRYFEGTGVKKDDKKEDPKVTIRMGDSPRSTTAS
jgi:hypothetical protein